jgi:hypothetical protein
MEMKATPLSPDNKRSCTMNGQVIHSIGIQNFLNNCASSDTSNIDFFAGKQQIERRWRECDMGCHNPGYRVLGRNSNYSEVISTLVKIDPSKGVAAGYIDGLVTTTSRVAKGVERTGEGLGLAGGQRIDEIGEENSLAFMLVKDALVKAFTLSLNLVDNPFTALIIKIITDYIKYIPDEVIVELAVHGKFKNLDIDMQMVVRASLKGLTNIEVTDVAIDGLKLIGTYLKNNPQMILKFIGKREGKKMATQIATLIAIAIAIAKNIAINLAMTKRYATFLKQVKPGDSNKNLAGILVFLLKSQGMLQDASNASHRLFAKSPSLWRELRQLNGLDMIYFFIEDHVSEYVDRLVLAERSPTRFIEMIVALLKPPGTAKDLFFLSR